MTPLANAAITEAAKVRKQLGIGRFEPVNIIDVCKELEVEVRFDAINTMEGGYITKGVRPYIILSNQRPMPRRYFTCAHELGHHRFGHGDQIDEFNEDGKTSNSEEEKLVDLFAGAFLMPVAAIQSQFAKRNWLASNLRPVEFLTIASAFSVGYETLITHCFVNKLISSAQRSTLIKTKPNQILKHLIPSQTKATFLKIIDKSTRIGVTDVEMDNCLILPEDCVVEGDHLVEIGKTTVGLAYVAVRPGIVRVACVDNTFGIFVRIQRNGYEGWAEYRHLEK